ncbi:hypothetical protein GEMRC1_007984 [Eukaryota sp. GEM-RC1]
MPPFCPYLTQLVTDSIARFRAQLSLDKDSSFCVLSTHTFVAMKYSSPLFIPSHPPFPKDLTADGDIESNPGPVTQEAINSVYPHQWVDDEAIVEYCKVIFQEAELDFESMFIHPTTWLQYIVSPDVPLDQWLLTKIQRNQRTNSKYLFVPLSDTMTRNANYSREGVTGSHWGLAIIDCCEKEWIFIDPMLTSEDMSKSMVKSAVDILSEVLVPWGYVFRYVPVTKTQSANDCGVYVIAYIQKYVELFKRLTYVPPLMYLETYLVQVNNELQADIFREKILDVLSQQRTLYLQQRQTTVAPIVPSLPIQPPAGKEHPTTSIPLTGSRLASTKTSTGLSTKKRKAKISDVPSPRGSPLIKRNKFRTTSSLVSTGDTPIRKTHRRMSTLESSEVPPSELPPSPSELPPSELPPKSQASIMSYPSPIQEEIHKMEVNLHTEPIEEEIQIQDFLKSPLLWNNLPTFCLIHVQSDFAKKERINGRNVQLVQEDDDDIETVEGEAEDQLEVKRDSSVDPIVSISIQIIDHNELNEKHLFSHGNFDTSNLDLCTLHISDSESSMLKNFISFITQHCPRLFVSYDFHLDTFPFLVSRCQVLKINTTFTFPEFKPYIPFWLNKWCKETTFGPFFSLDLNAVLKNFYVFTGGRFLENVVQIFLEMNNFSKNETVKRLEDLNHDSDPDEVQLVNNVQNLHGIIDSINVLVPDNPKVKVDKIKKKFVRNLEKVNELWAKESTKPLLLINSIQQLPLIEYLLADLLDPKKQTLRSKSPMKVVKKRLDNVVSKVKVKFIESRVKRAHQVRVRSYIQKLLPATVPNVTVKEEMNSDTDESTEEETDVHSESIDATAPPVKLENIEDASGEPEPDLWTKIQTSKIELPDWKNFLR